MAKVESVFTDGSMLFDPVISCTAGRCTYENPVRSSIDSDVAPIGPRCKLEETERLALKNPMLRVRAYR
jgi:hypothetical protein